MNLKASMVALALVFLQTAHAGGLRRASEESASLELAAGSAALARASAAADAQARRLQEAYITCQTVCGTTSTICLTCLVAAVPIVEAKIIPDLKAN